MAAKRKPIGRPPWVVAHPEKAQQVIAFLQAGNYADTVLAVVGMSKTAYYSTLAKGEDAIERRERGEQLDPNDLAYADFTESVKRAEAMGEVRAVRAVTSAFDDNWTAAMTFLERKYPRRWGRFDRIETSTVPEDPLADAVLNDPKVAELADQLLRSIIGEGNASGTGATD